jgi:hypothetical protein
MMINKSFPLTASPATEGHISSSYRNVTPDTSLEVEDVEVIVHCPPPSKHIQLMPIPRKRRSPKTDEVLPGRDGGGDNGEHGPCGWEMFSRGDRGVEEML